MSLDKAAKKRILERMLVIRRFEEALVEMFNDKVFKSHYHLYIGQEATAAAIVELLRPDDRLVTTHRNHGHIIARGADPGRALAEILGRATGLNGGRGGTLHLSDPEHGFLSTSAVVGGCIGLAIGGGYALQRRGRGGVAVPFFGDGSLEEGISFEALNIASLWKLPVLFVCENNGAGATGSAQGGFPAAVTAATRFTAIPESVNVPSDTVDGRDAEAVYAAASRALERARAGGGPAFIEAVTERWAGSKPMWPELSTGLTDVAMAWDASRVPSRIASAHRDWFENQDPILLFVRKLIAQKAMTKEEVAKLDGAVSERMMAARRFAMDSPMPRAETALHRVFA